MPVEDKKILDKVRDFLRKTPWKKLLTFSFFVCIAAALWFMQIYNQYFETTVYLPVKYVSVPDSVIFNDSLPHHLEVRLRDFGSSMFRYGLTKRDTVYIDMSTVTDNGTSKTLQGSSLEAYIVRSLPQSATVLRYDPVRISFAYSVLMSRKVPVVFDGQINLSPGYFLNGDIRVAPDSVMVYGSMSDLTKLTYIYTTSDTINGLETNRKIPYDLVIPQNLRLSPDRVNVYVPVEAYQQLKLEVPVEAYNLPDNLNVKFFPSNVTVSFFIGVSMADSVRVADFSAGVDYEGLNDHRQSSVPVRVTASPSFARSLTIEPPNVEYIFEYKE